MPDAFADVEGAALAHAPPGAVVVGSSVSPAGDYAVVVTVLPSAHDYLMDDLFVWGGATWELHSGGSAGISWTTIGDGPTGVLSYVGEAPAGASAALVRYEGREYRAAVREGYFALVVWDTRYREGPTLLRFE